MASTETSPAPAVSHGRGAPSLWSLCSHPNTPVPPVLGAKLEELCRRREQHIHLPHLLLRCALLALYSQGKGSVSCHVLNCTASAEDKRPWKNLSMKLLNIQTLQLSCLPFFTKIFGGNSASDKILAWILKISCSDSVSELQEKHKHKHSDCSCVRHRNQVESSGWYRSMRITWKYSLSYISQVKSWSTTRFGL